MLVERFMLEDSIREEVEVTRGKQFVPSIPIAHWFTFEHGTKDKGPIHHNIWISSEMGRQDKRI